MLPYFPRTYPDELLYSVLARYHCHTCSRSAAQTLGDLFGDHYVRATLDLPGHLGALSARLPPDRELTAERLAKDFTLFPYWTAFQPAGVSALSLASLINGSASRAHTCLGIVPSGVRLSRPLRFCPTCNAEAVARWGECFWRRAHQLPGVLVCPVHGTPLAEYAGLLELGCKHEFFAATAETCPADTPPPPWADDEECLPLLQEIARRSAALLTTRPNAETFETLTARYRRGLPELGLATTSRHIDHRHLHDAFAAAFKPVSTISASDGRNQMAGQNRSQAPPRLPSSSPHSYPNISGAPSAYSSIRTFRPGALVLHQSLGRPLRAGCRHGPIDL